MCKRPGAALLAFVIAAQTQGADLTLDLEKDNGIRAVPGSSMPLVSRLGVNIHSLDDDAGLDSARATGFGFVRMDLMWAQVEKNGRYDFADYDRLLSRLEARGMGVLWILDYGHPEHGGGQPHSEPDLMAFSRYAEAAAAHFRGHRVRYEVWNEPNLTKFLPDARVYPQLLDADIAGIRKSDASAIVSTGGVSTIDFQFFSLPVLAPSARRADAIGVHPYRSGAPETFMNDFPVLQDLVHRHFRKTMPIWDTEWGTHPPCLRHKQCIAMDTRKALESARRYSLHASF